MLISRESRLCTFLLVILFGLVVLAVALDLTLGILLQANTSPILSSTLVSVPAASATLLPQPESNFVLRSIQDELPRTRSYEFTVGTVKGAPDGVERQMLVVNGMYPGPTIEANQGDRILVTVKNNLPNRTSIHWHGLYQNSTPWYDGTMAVTECGIPPGNSLTYNFTFGQFFGTTWWQKWREDLTAFIAGMQYTDGVTGAIVVHPTRNVSGIPSWDEDLAVQLADWYHTFSEELLALYMRPNIGIDGTPGDEPVPDSLTINGLGQYGGGGEYFNFTVQRGKIYRLRILNTGSFASIKFSVDGHPLTLIEADSTPTSPIVVSSVTVAVAQRYSVLLTADATSNPGGLYWMRAEMQTDMFRYQQPGQNTDVRAVLRYARTYSDVPFRAVPEKSSSLDPAGLPSIDGKTELVPLQGGPPPDATVAYYLQYSFQKTSAHQFLGFMNKTSWEPLQRDATLFSVQRDPSGSAPQGASVKHEQFIIAEDSVQVVDLYISSLDDGDHPFHLHGHAPWIMASGKGRYIGQSVSNRNPFYRDTYLIPAYSWMALRFVTNNPGLWAFHCHIQWHMAAGLMMQFAVQPSTLAKWTVPEELLAQCSAVS
ncbi:multicopper oxidase 3B [Vararia minispora EC-137]|uniref:Multicopper oxidase 3B n=1 Tax=Vararia minispora EC-137 TaxID=1314806 RepID=A0ACB8QNL2_9AGAM|nr:multicopper oxidase 3B [Vararia minispora EC-137]